MNEKKKEIVYQLPTPDKLHALRAIHSLQDEENHIRHTATTAPKRFSSIVKHHVYVKSTSESLVYKSSDGRQDCPNNEPNCRHSENVERFYHVTTPHCSKDRYFTISSPDYTLLERGRLSRISNIKKSGESSIVEQHCDSTTDFCTVNYPRSSRETSPEPKITTTAINNNDERLRVASTSKRFENVCRSVSDNINSIYDVVETEQTVVEGGQIVKTPLRTYYLNPFSFVKLNPEPSTFNKKVVEKNDYEKVTPLEKALSRLSGESLKPLSTPSSVNVSLCESSMTEIKTPNEKVAMWKVDFDNAQNNDYVDFSEVDCLRVNERIINEKRIHLNKLRQLKLLTCANNASSSYEGYKNDSSKQIVPNCNDDEIVIISDTKSNSTDSDDDDVYEIAPGIIVRLPKVNENEYEKDVSSADDAEISPRNNRRFKNSSNNTSRMSALLPNYSNNVKETAIKECFLDSKENTEHISNDQHNNKKAISIVKRAPLVKTSKLQYSQNLHVSSGNISCKKILFGNSSLKKYTEMPNQNDIRGKEIPSTVNNGIDIISLSSNSSSNHARYQTEILTSTPKSNLKESKSSDMFTSTLRKASAKITSSTNRSNVLLKHDVTNVQNEVKNNKSPISNQKFADTKREVSFKSGRKKNDSEPPSPETTERNEFYSYLQIISKPLRKDGTPVIKNRRSVRVRNREITKQKVGNFDIKIEPRDRRDESKKTSPFEKQSREKKNLEIGLKNSLDNTRMFEMRKYISSLFNTGYKRKRYNRNDLTNIKSESHPMISEKHNDKIENVEMTNINKISEKKSSHNNKSRYKLQNIRLLNRTMLRSKNCVQTRSKLTIDDRTYNILKNKRPENKIKRSENKIKRRKILKSGRKSESSTNVNESPKNKSADVSPLQVDHEYLLKRSVEQAMQANTFLNERGFTSSEVSFSKHIHNRIKKALENLLNSYEDLLKDRIVFTNDTPNSNGTSIESVVAVRSPKKRKISDAVMPEPKKAKSISDSSCTSEMSSKIVSKKSAKTIHPVFSGPVTRLSFAAMGKTLTRSSIVKFPKLNIDSLIKRMIASNESVREKQKPTNENKKSKNEINKTNARNKNEMIKQREVFRDVSHEDFGSNEDFEQILKLSDTNIEVYVPVQEDTVDNLDITNNSIHQVQNTNIDDSMYIDNDEMSSITSDDSECTFRGFRNRTTEGSVSDVRSESNVHVRPAKIIQRSSSLPAYFEKEKVEKLNKIMSYVYNETLSSDSDLSENAESKYSSVENNQLEVSESEPQNTECIFNTESISRCPSPPFIPLPAKQPVKSLLKTFSRSVKNKQSVPCRFGMHIDTELSELFDVASEEIENVRIPSLRQIICDKIKAREEKLAAGVTSTKKRLGEHEIHIKEGDGVVLDMYFIDNVLIVVQEFSISFWQQTPLGTILGTQNMWLGLGSIQRLKLEQGCVNKRAPLQMITSVENVIAYIELWTKEHKSERRERPISDVFATVYFYQSKKGAVLGKKVIQLENIKGSEQDVQYVVLRTSRCILVSWHDRFKNPPVSLIRRYTLAPDFQTVANVAEVESVNHYIKSLHNVQECTEMVLGIGEQHISIWDLPHGQLISTVSLECSNPSFGINLNQTQSPEINCVWALCDRGFLFLLQKTENEFLQLIAIKGLRNEWKQLQTYRVPSGCTELRGVSVKGGILIACYAKHIVCWALQSGTMLLQCSSAPECTLFPSQRHLVSVDTQLNVAVKHVTAYLLED